MDPQTAREASAHFRRFREHGDSAALTAVFDRVAPELMALAAHLTRDPGDAEDLVQETFLVAIRKARRWDSRRPLVPWLAGILVREARKHRRRSRRSPHVDPGAPQAREDPPQGALQGELRAAVEGALGRLPATYAEVLRAHLLEGAGTPDIAQRLDRAPGTVRVQLHRGLELLRRALPAGLAPSLLLLFAQRGLGAVRRAVELEAVLRGPALAAAGAGAGAGAGLATSLPVPLAAALTMNVKTVALASTLFIALFGIAWVAIDDAPLQVGALADERESALEPQAARHSLDLERTEPPRATAELAPRQAAASAPEAPLAPAAAPLSETLAVLRANFSADGPVGPEGFRVLVRVDGERELELRRPGPGPFEVDLSELVAPSEARALSVNVEIAADGFQVARNYAGLVEDQPQGTVAVYEIELEMLSILRELQGRVVDASGRPIKDAWVVYLNEHRGMDPDWPAAAMMLSYAHLPETQTGADGRFEMALAEGGPATLLFGHPGHAVGSRQLDPDALGTLELGDLTLPEGVRISGRAEAAGDPLAPGSLVYARLPFEASPFTLNRRDVQLAGEGGAWRELRAVVGERGEFVLTGLEAGLEYRLVAEPRAGTGSHGPLVGFQATGMTVRAPAQGIVLDWGLVPVTLVVLSNGAPVPEPRVRPIPAPPDPRAGLPRLMGLKWSLPAIGDEHGHCALLLPGDAVTRLEVDAAGYEAGTVDIDPADLPGSGEVRIELAGGPEPATLVFVFTGGSAHELDRATLSLLDIDFEDGFDPLDPVQVHDGRARFEQVSVGCKQVSLSWHMPQTIPFDELPFILGNSTNLVFSPLEAGEVREVEVEGSLGGRIELRLLGRDPLLAAPVFELENDAGDLHRPTPIVQDPRGHDTRGSVEVDGPILLGRAVAPGHYRVRQLGPDYAATEHDVLVREREVAPLSFQLEPR